MLAFYTLRGLDPNIVAGSGTLGKKFFAACMELELERLKVKDNDDDEGGDD